MALSDKWTLSDLRGICRRELADPSGRFWTDQELNLYINDWQDQLQNDFEFVWGLATATQTTSGISSQWDFFQWDGAQFDASGSVTSLATITITDIISNMLRPDAIYFIQPDGTSANRVVPRSKIDIDFIRRDWPNADPQPTPLIVYQDDVSVINFWPTPNGTGTLVFEYPVQLAIASDTDTMSIPSWTRYSVKDFVGYRAHARFGATQNLQRASRYKGKFEMDKAQFRRLYMSYLPEKAAMLRPGRKWAYNILSPRRVFIEPSGM